MIFSSKVHYTYHTQICYTCFDIQMQGNFRLSHFLDFGISNDMMGLKVVNYINNCIKHTLIYVSRYITYLGVCISLILNNLIFGSCTELLAVVIRGLVRFIQVKKYMEHLSLNNNYLTFLGKW